MNAMKPWRIAIATLIVTAASACAAPMYQLADLGGNIEAGGLLQYLPGGAIGGLNGNWIAYPQFILFGGTHHSGQVLEAHTVIGPVDLPRGAIGTVFADLYGGSTLHGRVSVGEFQSGPNSGDALLLSQGMYRDLNYLVDSSAAGWRLERADSMNSAGQIIGVGRDPQGELHAYLLTPIDGSGSLAMMVPEPAGVVLAGLGVVSLFFVARRNRKA